MHLYCWNVHSSRFVAILRPLLLSLCQTLSEGYQRCNGIVSPKISGSSKSQNVSVAILDIPELSEKAVLELNRDAL